MARDWGSCRKEDVKIRLTKRKQSLVLMKWDLTRWLKKIVSGIKGLQAG